MDVERNWAQAVAALVGAGLFLWSTSPAPACEAMVGAEYSDPPEVAALDLASETWHVGRRYRDESRARVEYVKAEETLQDWTELVTWQVTFGPQDLASSMEGFLKTLRFQCPELESRTIREAEGELIFEWWHAGCYDRPAQYELVRLVVATTGGHMLAYDRRGAPVDAKARQQWLERLERTPIVSEIGTGEARAPLNRARLAIWSRSYQQAHEILGPLAKRGDAAAQEELARLAYEGWGTEQSYAKAIEWFQKAAAQEYGPAHYNLGRMYEDGTGVSPDLAKAREHFRKAAELGHPDAQGRIGFLIVNDPTPDYEAAAKWFERAVENGHDHADYWLGRMAEEGWGSEADLDEAVRHYRRAAISGEPDAQYRLALLYQEGRGVKADPAQAKKWAFRSAMQGNTDARQLVETRYNPYANAPRIEIPEALDEDEMRRAMTR